MFKKSIFLALASLCLPCFGQWHGTAWERLRWYTNDTPVVTQVWSTVHSVIVTNYVTNGPVLTTNRFINDIYFDQWSTVVTNSMTITAYSNGIATPWTYTYTNALIATNVALQPREVMAYDCYFAMLERMRAITNEAVARATVATFPKVFRNERESLQYVKDWLETWHPRFLRADLAGTNRDSYVDYFKAHPSDTPLMFDTTSLLSSNFPPNYLDETPWRELSPVSTGFYRVATCAIYFAESGVTQFMNCCGQNVVTNSVTNRQSASLVCTNTALWASAGTGYMQAASSTWGWRGITNLFNLLVHTTSGGCGASDGAGNSETTYQTAFYDLFAGPPCSSQASADLAVNAAYSNQTSADCGGVITNGAFLYNSYETCEISTWQRYYAQSIPFTNEFTSYAFGSGSLLRHHVGTGSTNISHIADLYVSVSTNPPFPYDPISTTNTVIFEYDSYGQSFTTNKSIFASVTASGNVTNAVLIGDDPTALQPVPAKPTVAPSAAGTTAVRGYANPVAFWVIRWNVTNGFRYK